MGRSVGSRALQRIVHTPVTVPVALLAGLFVQVLDLIVRQSPIAHTVSKPVSETPVGIAPSVGVQILSHVRFSRPALMGLESSWQFWALWVLGLEFLVTVTCGGLLFAWLRGVRLAPAGLARYGLVTLPTWGTMPIELGIVSTTLSLFLTVGVSVVLFVLPGLLVDGTPFGPALIESVTRTRRAPGTVSVAVLGLVGAYQLAGLVPTGGPVVSAMVGVGHASVVAAVLEETEPASKP